MIKEKILEIIEKTTPRSKEELLKLFKIKNKEKKQFLKIIEELENEGLMIKDLITRLIELGKKRHSERAANNYSIDSNLFNMTSYGAKI